MTAPHGYPDGATAEWLDELAAMAVPEVVESVNIDTVPLHLGSPAKFSRATASFAEEHEAFLHRASRGFLAEFLRQSAENIPEFNTEEAGRIRSGKTAGKRSKAAKQRAEREGAPGLFHATACADWLIRHKIPPEQAIGVVGVIILQTVNLFTEQYPEIDDDRDARASVLKNLDKMKQTLDNAMQKRANAAASSPNR